MEGLCALKCGWVLLRSLLLLSKTCCYSGCVTQNIGIPWTSLGWLFVCNLSLRFLPSHLKTADQIGGVTEPNLCGQKFSRVCLRLCLSFASKETSGTQGNALITFAKCLPLIKAVHVVTAVSCPSTLTATRHQPSTVTSRPWPSIIIVCLAKARWKSHHEIVTLAGLLQLLLRVSGLYLFVTAKIIWFICRLSAGLLHRSSWHLADLYAI